MNRKMQNAQVIVVITVTYNDSDNPILWPPLRHFPGSNLGSRLNRQRTIRHLLSLAVSCGQKTTLNGATTNPQGEAENSAATMPPTSDSPQLPVEQVDSNPSNPGTNPSNPGQPGVPDCDRQCLSDSLYENIKDIINPVIDDFIESSIPTEHQVKARVLANTLINKLVRTAANELAKVMVKEEMFDKIQQILSGDFDADFIEELLERWTGVEVDGILAIVLDEVERLLGR